MSWLTVGIPTSSSQPTRRKMISDIVQMPELRPGTSIHISAVDENELIYDITVVVHEDGTYDVEDWSGKSGKPGIVIAEGRI